MVTDGGASLPVVDDPLQELFRCQHWACTLAVKHCLRRQQETRTGGRNQKMKTIHPMYPHCASGECAQGVENAAKHPGFIAIERQDNQSAPRMDIIRAVEERTMPKRYRRGQACRSCSSRGTKHLNGCEEASAEPAPRVKPVARVEKIRAAAAKAKAPKSVVAAAEAQLGISERVERMTLDELLVWRGLIESQLAARERVLEDQLVEVRKAIRAPRGAAAEAA